MTTAPVQEKTHYKCFQCSDSGDACRICGPRKASGLKVGDYVQFAHTHGSIGRLEVEHHYGGFYVVWVYGRDKFGDLVKATSSVQPHELVRVTQAEYEAARDRRFNST